MSQPPGTPGRGVSGDGGGNPPPAPNLQADQVELTQGFPSSTLALGR